MEVIEYKKPIEWNQFLAQQKLSSFLQSWEWGEFQESLGRKIWRLGVINDKNNLFGVALVVRYDISFKKIKKNYLYIPRGPIIDNSEPKVDNLLVDKIKAIAEEQNSLFVRFDPGSKLEILKNKRAKPTKFVQPKDTWILDLTQDKKTILSQMHHKTRYNIHLAERRGLIIKEGNSKSDIISFLHLLQKTAQRNNFKIYPPTYYEKLFKQLRGVGYEIKKIKPFIKLYLANYNGQVIAANMVMFFGDTATYLYGASDVEHHNLMAPHLLQWHAIIKAKAGGYKYYDFWGIAPADSFKSRKANLWNRHPWAGITRFKKSFGGFDQHYPGAFDLVMKKLWYKLYRLAKKLK